MSSFGLEDYVAAVAKEVSIQDLSLRSAEKADADSRQKLLSIGFEPEQLLEVMQSFDGQEHAICKTPLFGEYRLLSIAESLQFWRENNDEFGEQESGSANPRIRAGLAWRQLWLPFAWDSDFNTLLIADFDPSEQGEVGQVFLYDCRTTPGRWLAASFAAFLGWYHQQLQQSGWSRDPDTYRFQRVDPLE
jgi:cell wall assembly regulator SMI1